MRTYCCAHTFLVMKGFTPFERIKRSNRVLLPSNFHEILPFVRLSTSSSTTSVTHRKSIVLLAHPPFPRSVAGLLRCMSRVSGCLDVVGIVLFLRSSDLYWI